MHAAYAQQRRRPKVLDHDGKYRLLKKAATSWHYPVILLGASTGMRRGELLALRWSGLDWDKAVLEVSKSVEETDQGLRIKYIKSNEPRSFWISADVIEALREPAGAALKSRLRFSLKRHRTSKLISDFLGLPPPDGSDYVPPNLIASSTEDGVSLFLEIIADCTLRNF